MTAKAFFVGLAMGSYDYEYRAVHALLALLRAQRVSKRIWLVMIHGDVERVVSILKRSLANYDGALLVEFPDDFDLAEWRSLPAFDAPDPLQLADTAVPVSAPIVALPNSLSAVRVSADPPAPGQRPS